MSKDFQRALKTGDVPRVESILAESSANIDKVNGLGATPLMLANGLPMVQLLLESGADITAKDVWGQTAFIRAARKLKAPNVVPSFPVVEWLLAHGGADMNDIWIMLEDGPVGVSITYAAKNAVLRFAALRGITISPGILLTAKGVQLVKDSARLRACYLANRRATLNKLCPLPSDLQALVHDYNEFTINEELWSMGTPIPLPIRLCCNIS
jgi:hypothetical protein